MMSSKVDAVAEVAVVAAVVAIRALESLARADARAVVEDLLLTIPTSQPYEE